MPRALALIPKLEVMQLDGQAGGLKDEDPQNGLTL